MRILEICPFSKGVDGVWARVFAESFEFKKNGHEVMVFSSDIVKGDNKKTDLVEEELGGVKIRRFKARFDQGHKIFTKNVVNWLDKSVFDEIVKYNPDVIITHLLHPHSAFISHRIKKLKDNNPNLKVLLVTHSPFNVERGFILSLLTKIWYKFALRNINKFDKIIAITKWEYPYLKKLGIDRGKIEYIPNGVPVDFYNIKIEKPKSKKTVLFLGRIAPVKNIETIILAAKELKDYNFYFVGTSEKDYMNKIDKMCKGMKNVHFVGPIYNLKDKIKIIDKNNFFVLSSKREAMPQVLIEAMARGKIIVTSSTDGGREIILNGKNGFIFDIDDSHKLVEILIKNKDNNFVSQRTIKDSQIYSWDKLIKKYEDIIK